MVAVFIDKVLLYVFIQSEETDKRETALVVNVVDLLCVCVEQDCKVARKYCHSWFDLDSLLRQVHM